MRVQFLAQQETGADRGGPTSRCRSRRLSLVAIPADQLNQAKPQRIASQDSEAIRADSLGSPGLRSFQILMLKRRRHPSNLC